LVKKRDEDHELSGIFTPNVAAVTKQNLNTRTYN
jgi:hypothetical protein